MLASNNFILVNTNLDGMVITPSRNHPFEMGKGDFDEQKNVLIIRSESVLFPRK